MEENIVTFDQMTHLYVELFKILGFIPYDRDLNRFRVTIKQYCCHIIWHLVNASHNTMYLGYGIRMLLNNSMDVSLVCEIIVVQGICLRYLFIYLQRRDLVKIVEFCKKLWNRLKSDEICHVRAFERKVYYLWSFFFWNSIAITIFYILVAQIVRLPPLEVNGTERRILPLKFYVDVQDEPWYMIATIFQIIAQIGIIPILVGIETVGPFLIMMTCGYLRVLQNRFLAMKYETHVNKLLVNEVTDCVEFHQQIMQFSEKIEIFMRSVYMVQVLCTIYNSSIVGIVILNGNENRLKYATILILNLMQFFACQWFPEHIFNESDAIVNAAYSASLLHSEYEYKANRMLLIVMLRAAKPVEMTAGGYIKLSLEYFQRMVVNAFSFFTVLRSMSE